MKALFDKYDTDGSGLLSLDEFIGLAYALIKAQDSSGTVERSLSRSRQSMAVRSTLASNALGDNSEDAEEEEVPEEFTHLSPEQQQAAIKKKAFTMLAIGTFLVMLFSDPMVDVMQEIANRVHLSAFYVSFCLAPLASNASELLASMFYASKKTRKTITVSLSTLCGAASLNNTFCLSIFFFLIYFRGLAWQYSAETLSIVVVEAVMGLMVQRRKLTMVAGIFILSIFPLSLVLVATMEHFGFD
jgi:Ca2+/Na+ antiporter